MSRSQSSRSAGLSAREAGAMGRAPCARGAGAVNKDERSLCLRTQADLAFLATDEAADVGVVAQDHQKRDQSDSLGEPDVPSEPIGVGRGCDASGERRERGVTE